MIAPTEGPSRSQPDATFWRDYLAETRRPLLSLCFLLPLLVVYEAGILWTTWGHHGSTVAGAHAWIIAALDWLGYGGLYLPPVVVVVALLGWHLVEGYPWRVRNGMMGLMLVESLVLALALVALSYLVLTALGREPASGPGGSLYDLLLYLGAGIYEEALFRLLLLPALYGLGLLIGLPKRPSAAAAVAVSALVFALAHHVGPYGQPWALEPFVFRTTAGAFFAVVFVTRGFGLTVGAHAAYDILVG